MMQWCLCASLFHPFASSGPIYQTSLPHVTFNDQCKKKFDVPFFAEVRSTHIDRQLGRDEQRPLGKSFLIYSDVSGESLFHASVRASNAFSDSSLQWKPYSEDNFTSHFDFSGNSIQRKPGGWLLDENLLAYVTQ